jgi:sugar lactone lactonase YvrE
MARYDLDLSMNAQYLAKELFAPAEERLRYLPEGPRFLRGTNEVGWVAIQDDADSTVGSLNRFDLVSGKNRSLPLPGRPGFFAETEMPGKWLVGMERQLVLVDWGSGAVEELGVTVSNDDRVIINDGLAVEGGVLFGTKHLGFSEPIAALYFFDAAARTLHTVLDGQTCSNGKDLRGAQLIDIDSTPKAISRYHWDAATRRATGREFVVAPEQLPAYPDGLRPSPDGESVIVAFFSPGAVSDGVARMYRVADGAVECEWVIPGSPRVTCPEFVEIDGAVKIVFTTAVEGMAAEIRELAPGAGSLYIADTPFDRMPTRPPLVKIQ